MIQEAPMTLLNRIGILTTLCSLSLTASYAYETLQGPTETRYWDESRAYNSYSARGVRSGTTNAGLSVPELVALSGGPYEMGDHHNLGGAEHPNDEIPVHAVRVSAFEIGKYETRNDQYVAFLNSVLPLGQIEVRTGLVYQAGTSNLYCETRAAISHSRIGWDGALFSVLDGRSDHPATGIRWFGAAAYCNWLSDQTGHRPCYDTATWDCNLAGEGFRLPTDAEWEYAGRGGLYAPYRIYPWGDDADDDRANWPASGDPYESGDNPLTTPVGFFDGSLRQKADFGWPDGTNAYQTADGANAHGLYDMAGNVWEWVNDWYHRDYYEYCVSNNVVTNPPGPVAGTAAPDGKPYRALRGGNWYNGAQGHSRVSNRNLSYYRGPDDPDHAWYHIGFRVLRRTASSSNTPPVIADVARTPVVPTDADGVWVTATVTDDVSVAQVTITFDDGSSDTGSVERTVFLDTMRTAAAKPWTGDGCDNAWTVTASPAANVEQRTGANYGDGNPCGAEFHRGTTDLTDTMIETTSGIDATGTSGYVEFWVWTAGLTNSQGWTFQLDAGSGYVTRLSELTGTSHGWQEYHYDLAADERVSDLKMRFQFRGGDGDPRVDLDQISVKVMSVNPAAPPNGSTTVTMHDDGAHGDGEAGDGVYGGLIPTRSAGTTVDYYLAGTDGSGATTTDPAGAPATTYSYTVSAGVTNRTVGLMVTTPAACEGYTLIAPKHYTNTYLINNEGLAVNSWTSAHEPGQSAYLLENGNLLRTCFIKKGQSIGGGEGGRIEEYAWDGTMVWELDYYSATYSQHHDIEPLPNGNVLMLVVEKKTYAEVIQAGFNPSLLTQDVTQDGYMMSDSVIEVAPTRPSGGTVVWEWHVWDHLIQDHDATKDNYGVVADHPELVDVNQGRAAQFWNHMNSIDYNPNLDQVILSVRGNSELWVIDHSTTTAEAAGHAGGRSGKGGDLLYRWGNPAMYDAPSGQILLQQHDAQWVEPGRPGAGNMLIFNNGLSRNYSSIDEIVPPAIDTNGNYALTLEQAYEPSTLAWTYTATPPTNMYAEAISGCQRQPNGNTLICDGTHGDLLEVTTAGQTVWQYICPVQNTGPMTQGEMPSLDIRNHQYNAVFKVQRYPTDYPGLAGRNLTPQGPIELYTDPSADSDGDGMLDAWEVGNGLNPALAADASRDADGDGCDNRHEYGADTDPNDAVSFLGILDTMVEPDGLRITWQGGTDVRQHLETRANLMSPASAWTAIFTNEPTTPVTNTHTVPFASGNAVFYRIRAER
jgi:formylglycine-generating enzyme required for sulfatase activity